ncbi:CDP-diacylglycerol O-phosphatidyltransferase [Blastococcus sp. TML/M2B]|uniref:CDP-alcohol phosphatidyltransferase family protein n=1 Tax=unclassified Blastococcus TaxID=2619396 RepID=UPI00190C3FB9|nr:MULTISPECIES: CDP-alcohol phosphatidyltransferase family protein [unclassified Blastococcus]MBN1093581.1 CDP-diacylglycerol O-phosphatidyltransferase [Blastococcus sp. TML/M2B]MBN1096300.1 CDP-diacylglycerol O-phosphatidyltransferase [Blastococcus sp. TML/C7B]
MQDQAAPPAETFSRRQRLAGAAVHVYTASGSVLGLLIVLAALEGDVEAALWLGLAALFVDGTDGMLARRFRVKETIPWFDGALLDNIVDYLTYVFAPVVLLWTTGHLPEGAVGWVVAAVPLLASCYQFCRVDAKTSDHFFLGFPSYWNVVAFYVIVLDTGELATSISLLVFAVLVFVPIRYLYPSRMGALRGVTLAFTLVWLVTYAVLVVQLPDPAPWAVAASLAYVVYYWGLSFWLTARGAGVRRAARSVQGSQGD